jgi:hypothetical protein
MVETRFKFPEPKQRSAEAVKGWTRLLLMDRSLEVPARSSPIPPSQRRSPERHRVISRVHLVIMPPLSASGDFRNVLGTDAAALCKLGCCFAYH